MSIAPASTLDRFEADAGLTAQASYSSLTLHRKCPQAWYYRHDLRIERSADAPAPYLTLGTWWSVLRAVESLERGRYLDSLKYVPRDLRDKVERFDFDPTSAELSDVLKSSEERWGKMSADARDAFVDKLGATLPERLHSMYDIWSTANQDRFEREQPLGAEVFFKRALPRPEGDAAWSLIGEPEKVPTMYLIGYIDELYYDRERKMIVVRDHKAPMDLSNTTSSLDDLMDSQLQVYAWGIAPKLKLSKLPAPRAVAYDRTKSVAPKQPVLTATGTLSKAVTAYDAATYQEWAGADQRPAAAAVEAAATDKGMNPEGLQSVLDRMEPGPFWGKLGDFYAAGAKKGLPKFGTYQADPKIVENLSTPAERRRWTMRTLVPVNRNMISAHLRSAVDTALDIFQTQTRAAATGEAARNLDRRGCAWCDYASLCRAQLFGGPSGEYDLEAHGLRAREPSVHS